MKTALFLSTALSLTIASQAQALTCKQSVEAGNTLTVVQKGPQFQANISYKGVVTEIKFMQRGMKVVQDRRSGKVEILPAFGHFIPGRDNIMFTLSPDMKSATWHRAQSGDVLFDECSQN